MECPKCGLISPPVSSDCDCGYDFVTGVRPKANAGSANPIRQPVLLALIGAGAVWAGPRIVAAILPVGSILKVAGVFAISFAVGLLINRLAK